MNELRELKAMRAEAPPPSTESLHAMRRQLTTGTKPKRRLPAFAWRTAAVGALAGTILLGVTVADDVGSSPERVANATVFLRDAADAIDDDNTRHVPRPRPHQWIYTKTINSWPDVDDEETESWYRFDGRKLADYIPECTVNCEDGISMTSIDPSEKGDQRTMTPALIWDKLEALPRDPEQLLDEVYEMALWANYGKLDKDQAREGEAVWIIRDLLGAQPTGTPPPSDIQASLFRALALIPGIEVTTNVEDPAGRDAVKIAYRPADQHLMAGYQFFVDPATYVYLGTVSENGTAAVVETQIVDRAGERP